MKASSKRWALNSCSGYRHKTPAISRKRPRACMNLPLLSDEKLALTKALELPTFIAAGMTLLKRMALVIDDGTISKAFYPVFPPDKNAEEVIAWLQVSARG